MQWRCKTQCCRGFCCSDFLATVIRHDSGLQRSHVKWQGSIFTVSSGYFYSLHQHILMRRVSGADRLKQLSHALELTCYTEKYRECLQNGTALMRCYQGACLLIGVYSVIMLPFFFALQLFIFVYKLYYMGLQAFRMKFSVSPSKHYSTGSPIFPSVEGPLPRNKKLFIFHCLSKS